MAIITKNLVLQGASGKLGETLVIRQWAGSTIITAAPGKRTKEPTVAQKEHQQHFQQAILYGKLQVAVPENKAEYQTKAEGMRSAFNVAVADFMHAPDIHSIDLSHYHGSIGDPILIRATDDFKVEQVQVSITSADGSLLEAGNATRPDGNLDWIYTATIENTATDGCKIDVRAIDKPGNVTEKIESL